MKLDQAIRNLTCGDVKIPFLVIGLGGTGLKKTRLVYFLNLFGGRGVVLFSKCVCVCEVLLDDWAIDGSADVFFTFDEYCFSSVGF